MRETDPSPPDRRAKLARARADSSRRASSGTTRKTRLPVSARRRWRTSALRLPTRPPIDAALPSRTLSRRRPNSGLSSRGRNSDRSGSIEPSGYSATSRTPAARRIFLAHGVQVGRPGEPNSKPTIGLHVSEPERVEAVLHLDETPRRQSRQFPPFATAAWVLGLVSWLLTDDRPVAAASLSPAPGVWLSRASCSARIFAAFSGWFSELYSSTRSW